MNKLFIVVLLVLVGVNSFAQDDPKKLYSPYSQGNLGFEDSDFYTRNFGMANVGIAQHHIHSPNLKNPALLVYNKFTILDANIGYRNDNFQIDTSVRIENNAKLSSINLIMPFSYKWSSALSLSPSNNTSYGARTITPIIGTVADSISQFDTGYGGIQKVTWANGFNVYKGINFGAALSYSFGNITAVSGTEIINDNNSEIINKISSTKYNGFNFQVGASYHGDVTWAKPPVDYIPKKDTLFTVNVYKEAIIKRTDDASKYTDIQYLDTIVETKEVKSDSGMIQREIIKYEIKYIDNTKVFSTKKILKNSELVIVDTTIKTQPKPVRKLRLGLGSTYSTPLSWSQNRVDVIQNSFVSTIDTTVSGIEAPSKIGVGFSVGNLNLINRWSLAADYELTNSYNYSSGILNQVIPSNSKMSVGFQITPEVYSEKFFRKTTYSVGAYQAKTPYLYNGTQLNEVGMHFGLSFVDKAKRSNESIRWREKSGKRINALSRYNVGLGFGMIGGNEATAIQQTFIKFNLGISLNSEWFIRRKIN